ncbi:hypothetical protein PPROV_001106800 [Pycnococcus provasolii]|uniref:RNA helicase n=1 Tax=Pycnococcus provasolii TaxID=41880 RepID=A0A830I2S6_9CHLO|nr:hypothetical protein PPROV_001106800 [Pycnococcus provasolii]
MWKMPGGGNQPAVSSQQLGGKGDRKQRRRDAQAATVAAKVSAQAVYFWQCRAQAAARPARSSTPATGLFDGMSKSGIRFDDYEEVPVERSGPGQASPPALASFAELAVPGWLRANVQRMNYAKPTPIQAHAVPLALDGRNDLMCCAQTGSGKTAGFLLPILAQLGAAQPAPIAADAPCAPAAVIMAPTRELAAQIHLEAQRLSFGGGAIRAVVVYGGAKPRPQLQELAHGCDVLVATPGRLTEFVDSGVVSLAGTRFLVLDEADRMLDMGFEPQIRRLVLQRDMPPKSRRQTLLFSATFPHSIQQLAREFMRHYTWIGVGRVGSTVSAITQEFELATNDKRHKLQLLCQALATKRDSPAALALVFVQKKHVARWVANQLCKEMGVSAESIHGDRSQSQREAALAAFRSGASPVLVATDVAARGIDVPGVALVVNFDLPTTKDDFDSYVHRIGRTGRAGREGKAVSFFVPGYDPKTGNGKIAPLLAQLLQETGQLCPPFLSQVRAPAAPLAPAPFTDTRSEAQQKAPPRQPRAPKRPPPPPQPSGLPPAGAAAAPAPSPAGSADAAPPEAAPGKRRRPRRGRGGGGPKPSAPA